MRRSGGRLRYRFRRNFGFASSREAVGSRPNSVARANVALLQAVADESHLNRAPAAIRIGLRVVADGIEMREIVSNGRKGLLFISPVLREIRFASGCRAHALENRGGHRLQP